MLLSPFCILGGEAVFRVVTRLFRFHFNKEGLQIGFLLLVLLPYFLFNTGAIYQLSGDVPTSISLSPGMDWAYYSLQEERGAGWLALNMKKPSVIYVDFYAVPLFFAYGQESVLGALGRSWVGEKRIYDAPAGAYVFLKGKTIRDGEVILAPEVRTGATDYVKLEETVSLSARNKIYASGGAEIYQ